MLLLVCSKFAGCHLINDQIDEPPMVTYNNREAEESLVICLVIWDASRIPSLQTPTIGPHHNRNIAPYKGIVTCMIPRKKPWRFVDMCDPDTMVVTEHVWVPHTNESLSSFQATVEITLYFALREIFLHYASLINNFDATF